MKHLFATLILIAASMAAGAQSPSPQPLTAAVLDFGVQGKDFEKKGADLAVLLNAKLSSSPNLVLVERQELDKVLGEQELGLSGTVTPDTAAKIGQLTGANVLITGRLFGNENKFFAVAKIISTETGRVYGETVTFSSLDALDTAANELAPKIQTIIDKRADTLIAKIEDPAARIDRLKALVAGKKLPTVSVHIAEQHINHALIDPAAQTEIQNILQKVGFEVIDPSTSSKKPDVAVTGEAISELAGRHGNLISCRSRVEIKITQTSDGKLLLSDRQTGVSSDIAESVAGKASLENAAVKLVDRIVPVLVKAGAGN